MEREFNKSELGMIWALLAQETDHVRSCYEGTEPFEESAVYRHIRQAIMKTVAQYEALEAKDSSAFISAACEAAVRTFGWRSR